MGMGGFASQRACSGRPVGGRPVGGRPVGFGSNGPDLYKARAASSRNKRPRVVLPTMESRVGLPNSDSCDDDTADTMDRRPLLRTFTVTAGSAMAIAVNGPSGVAAGIRADNSSEPSKGAQVIRPGMQAYAQMLRARLRKGAASRTRGAQKTKPVPAAVARLVTAAAVEHLFSVCKAGEFCAVCGGESAATMSLQLVDFTDQSITLAPMCRSCAVGQKKAMPARVSKSRVLKMYAVWKELTRVTFEGSKHAVQSNQMKYYRRMTAAAKKAELRGDEWKNASEHEQRLFLHDLRPELEKRNDTVYYRKLQEKKRARERAEAHLRALRDAVEHARPDYL